MAQSYKIVKVSETVKTWESSYGPMKCYYVLLEGEGQDPVQINKKPDSPAPQVGDEIYGELQESSYGYKFKSVQRPQGQGKPYSPRQSDDYTMYLSYAKDVAIALMSVNGKIDANDLNEALEVVAAGGDYLYLHHKQTATAKQVMAGQEDDKPVF